MRDLSLLVVVICLVASPARAALTLNIESPRVRRGEVRFIEVFANEFAPAQDERLVAYSIGLTLPEGSPLMFGPGPIINVPVNHPFVFPAGTPIEDLGSNSRQVRALASVQTGTENVTDNEGFLRVPISIRPDYEGPACLLVVNFELTGGLTEMSDDIGNVIEFVPVNGVFICPEPSSAMMILFGMGLVALRRRQRRRTAA
jgi:hypothetical protein